MNDAQAGGPVGPARPHALAPPAVQIAPSVPERPPELDLESLRSEFEPKHVLEHLTERFIQEQGWFWSRFAAFAGLHAGMFVLVTSDVIMWKAQFGLAGGVLGALWWAVQRFSLGYVKHSKMRYYGYLDDHLGFDRLLNESARGAKPSSIFTNPRWSSATVAGVVTSGVVWAVWAIYLISV